MSAIYGAMGLDPNAVWRDCSDGKTYAKSSGQCACTNASSSRLNHYCSRVDCSQYSSTTINNNLHCAGWLYKRGCINWVRCGMLMRESYSLGDEDFHCKSPLSAILLMISYCSSTVLPLPMLSPSSFYTINVRIQLSIVLFHTCPFPFTPSYSMCQFADLSSFLRYNLQNTSHWQKERDSGSKYLQSWQTW